MSKTRNYYLIAEVGQAHEGSVNLAHNFIDQAKKNGANAIKFQCHYADFESSKKDKFRVKPQYESYKNRYEYWKKMEFSEEDWSNLYKHSKDSKIDFICSPFSLHALNIIEKTGVDIYKIASGELSNTPLLEKINLTNKKVILSTGLNTFDEIKKYLNYLNKEKVLSVLHCISKYPSLPGDIDLNIMKLYKNHLNLETGLSDHSGTIYPSLAAYIEGGRFFEVHVTFDKNMKNFDSSSSINFNELKILSDGLKFYSKMINSKIDKNKLDDDQKKLRKLFSKNAVLKIAKKAGSKLEKHDLIFLKPNIGISQENIDKYIGKRLKQDLRKNHFLKKSDIII